MITKIGVGLITVSITNIIYLLLAKKITIKFYEIEEPMVIITLLCITSIIVLLIPKMLEQKMSLTELTEKGKKIVEIIRIIINIVVISIGGILIYKVYVLHNIVKNTITNIYTGSIIEIKRVFSLIEKEEWIEKIKKITNFDETFWQTWRERNDLSKINDFSTATTSVKLHAENNYSPLIVKMQQVNKKIESLMLAITGEEETSTTVQVIKYTVYAGAALFAIYLGYLGAKKVYDYLLTASKEDLTFGKAVKDGFDECGRLAGNVKNLVKIEWDINGIQIKLNKIMKSSLEVLNRKNVNGDVEIERLREELIKVWEAIDKLNLSGEVLNCATKAHKEKLAVFNETLNTITTILDSK